MPLAALLTVAGEAVAACAAVGTITATAAIKPVTTTPNAIRAWILRRLRKRNPLWLRSGAEVRVKGFIGGSPVCSAWTGGVPAAKQQAARHAPARAGADLPLSPPGQA